MLHLLCQFWVILLALSLPCLVAWLCWPRAHRSDGEDPWETTSSLEKEQAPRILWLTPACAAALGNCSRPAVLAEASIAKIGRMLERGHYPDDEKMPGVEHYETWPEQAALLAAGNFQALRDWQRPWLQGDEIDVDDRPEQDDATPAGRRHQLRIYDLWLASAILLLFLALVAGITAARANFCGLHGCGGPVSPPPKLDPLRLELSTDTIFDYKMQGSYHPALLERNLRRLLEPLDGVQIVSVEGHTDPIGATADNVKLGSDRASTVLAVIARLRKGALASRFGPEPLPSAPTVGGARAEDAATWNFCFARFQLQVPDRRFRPLRDLDEARNPDGRPDCASASSAMSGSAYPACAGPYDRVVSPRMKVFARKAENFREMTSCLSPMRHVVVNLRYLGRAQTSF